MNWAEIFSELLRFFPRWEILDPDEGGLFLRMGKLRKCITPGMYFCFPYIDAILRYTTALITMDSVNQSITSKDKKDILLSWSATYLIHSPVKAFLDTDDVEHQIASSISARIVEYVAKHDYEILKGHLLQNHIIHKEYIKILEDEWGIQLKGFYLHDFSLHKIFRLISSKITEDIS